jgi:hypothetical protein
MSISQSDTGGELTNHNKTLCSIMQIRFKPVQYRTIYSIEFQL